MGAAKPKKNLPYCGHRYGRKHELVCRRLPRHTGQHALRPTVAEIMSTLPPPRPKGK